MIESTFDVGHRFRCTMRVDCGQPDPGGVIQPIPGEWQPRMPERLDDEELADWRAGRNAVYQLATLTIGARLADDFGLGRPPAGASDSAVQKPRQAPARRAAADREQGAPRRLAVECAFSPALMRSPDRPWPGVLREGLRDVDRFAVEIEKIEQEEHQRRGGAAVGRQLDHAEEGDAVGTHAAQLAVEIGLPCPERRHG
jgi:hypothetical protein